MSWDDTDYGTVEWENDLLQGPKMGCFTTIMFYMGVHVIYGPKSRQFESDFLELGWFSFKCFIWVIIMPIFFLFLANYLGLVAGWFMRAYNKVMERKNE